MDPARAIFRRIVVGVDASPSSIDAGAAAATLAARLGAELAGLFVEDEDLLRLATLPFADVVRVPSGERERLDPRRAEAELRAFASRAREALQRAAAALRLTSTFRVARGRVIAEVLAAATAADLLVLGTGGHSRHGSTSLGDTARAAAERAQSSVLLLPRGARIGGRVVVADDGSPAAGRAIAAARALSPDPGPVVVEGSPGSTAVLAGVLARLDAGLVVMPASSPLATRGGLAVLLSTGIPVLLVR